MRKALWILSACLVSQFAAADYFDHWFRVTNFGGITLAGTRGDLALDSQDQAHICYIRNENGSHDLYYVTNSTGPWTSLRIASNVSDAPCSIAVDQQGNAHVAFIEPDASSGEEKLSYATNYTGTWAKQILVSGQDLLGTTDYGPDIAVSGPIENSTTVHIAFNHFTDNDVKYARWQSGSWTFESAAGSPVGQSILGKVSIAIEADGTPYIAYDYARSPGSSLFIGVKLLKRNTYAWSSWLVEEGDFTDPASQQNASFMPKLNIKADGTKVVSFIRYDDLCNYEWVSAHGIWKKSVVTVGDLHSASVDRFGNVYNLFQNSGNLLLASSGLAGIPTSGGVDYIGFPASREFSIEMDSGDKAHVLYPIWVSSGTEYLYYANNAVGDTDTMGAPSSGSEHMAVGVDDTHGDFNLYFVLYDSVNKRLKLRKRGPTPSDAWSEEIIDSSSSDVGQYPSFAVAPNGDLNISYYDVANQSLKFATRQRSATTWTIETVDNTTSSDVGKFSSITLDSAQVPHVSYFDAANGNLMLAHRWGGVWTRGLSDGNTSFVGSYSSLVVGPSETAGYDRFHACYWDATYHRLKYRWVDCDSVTGACPNSRTEVVDYNGGLYCDILLSDTYQVSMSYYDNTNHRLMHAMMDCRASGSCVVSSTSIVDDTSADTGKYTSIVKDSLGRERVTYYDVTEQELRHSVQSAGVWVLKDLTKLNNQGNYATTIIDARGHIHVVHSELPDNLLTYTYY